MKRMLIFVVVVMLTGPLFAEEAVLIDFSELKADIHVKVSDDDKGAEPNQNRQTLMDFSHVAGGSFTKEQKRFMKTSLAISNWEIVLASSSRSIGNIGKSFTKEAKSKSYWGNEETIVMGVRIHFPIEPQASWALVKPPFDIPAFEPQANIDNDGNITPSQENNGITGKSRFEPQTDGGPAFGVVKNVGVIKQVAVNAYGLNFPHSLSTVLIDSDGNQKSVFMGYMQYNGWGELIWNNPSYVQEIRNRDIRLYPLYPASTPFIKFGGFIIQRDPSKEGGDFITYFKNVKIIFDKAVQDPNRDIDDEALWNIIYDRESARKIWEMERFGQNQVLRYLETQKQASELPFGHPDRPENKDQ